MPPPTLNSEEPVMTMRIDYRHADRLISYPHAHNLSMRQQPIRVHNGPRPTGTAKT